MKKITGVALALLVPALLLGTWAGAEDAKKAGAAHKVAKAICVVNPSSGSNVHGVVHFVQTGHKVEVNGEISGLTPGQHGFHVHEFGDCSDPKGMSAGGHFNPDNKMHGGPHDKDRHVGDLGNITADEAGKAVIKITDSLLSLHGGHSIIGHSLIVHAKADDLKTQPSGDAGGRVGCGVIGVAKE